MWFNKIFINIYIFKCEVLRIIIASNEIALWMTSLRLPLSRQFYNAVPSRSFFSPWTWDESGCSSPLQEIQCFKIEYKRRLREKQCVWVWYLQTCTIRSFPAASYVHLNEFPWWVDVVYFIFVKICFKVLLKMCFID